MICSALTLVGCPPNDPPVPTPEEPVVVEPAVPEPCNQTLCSETLMPTCITSAGEVVNAATVCDWLLLCERPLGTLPGAGKSTGCYICVEERNPGYLTWRHQFHIQHGAASCQDPPQ